VLSGVVASNAMEVTTDTDFLTTRELASQVKSLRDSGLSDAVVRDVINGTPISQEQHDGFVRFKKRCLTDREWLIRYKSGDADAIADFRLFSAGVIAPVIGAKR
jgi:hypothetical protein